MRHAPMSSMSKDHTIGNAMADSDPHHARFPKSHYALARYKEISAVTNVANLESTWMRAFGTVARV